MGRRRGPVRRTLTAPANRSVVGATAASVRLAGLCRALGNPVRLAIVGYLRAQPEPRSCGEIVAQLPRAQSTVSRHLQVLTASGLVTAFAEPPHVRYGVAPGAVEELRRLVAAL
jgi:ArsR family transcriptional regulator, arsenate/arsenite/antimonite-responsive transcriptional repressor